MDWLRKLHGSMMYVASTTETDKLENLKCIDKSEFKKYLTYQQSYKDRVADLRTTSRTTPAEPNTDLNMPPILVKWTGNKDATQHATKNFAQDTTCAFTVERIKNYETANISFANDVKKAGHVAAKSIASLIVHDIAYLKTFEVEWEPTASALETGRSQASDDDDIAIPELDFLSWSTTDLQSVPWNSIKIAADEKLAPHVVFAGALTRIHGAIDEEMERVEMEFKDRVHLQIDAKPDDILQAVTSILTRPFSRPERDYFLAACSTGVQPDAEGEPGVPAPAGDAKGVPPAGDAESSPAPAPPSPPAVPQKGGRQKAIAERITGAKRKRDPPARLSPGDTRSRSRTARRISSGGKRRKGDDTESDGETPDAADADADETTTLPVSGTTKRALPGRVSDVLIWY